MRIFCYQTTTNVGVAQHIRTFADGISHLEISGLKIDCRYCLVKSASERLIFYQNNPSNIYYLLEVSAL
jgi:hypothetical protein